MPPRPTRHRFLFCTTLLAFLAACGSDTTAPQRDDVFSSDEATEIALVIFEEMSHALSGAGFNRASMATAVATAVPVTLTQTYSGNCSKGGAISGSVAMTANMNDNGAGTQSGTMSITPKGCRVNTGRRTITVDGEIVYTLDVTMAQNFEASQFTIRGRGAFTWSGGDCDVDYTMNSAGARATISGSICGVRVSGRS